MLRSLWSSRLDDVPQSLDQTDQNVPEVPVEIHPSDQIRQTNRAVYRLNPRMSGIEVRPNPRPDDRTDRTEARLSRPTWQAKTDGQARINLARANSDSDHGFSLLSCLARTACTDDRADDLSTLFDPIMDFSFGNLTKARILHLSEDIGHTWPSLVHETDMVVRTDSPTSVLLFTAVHASGYNESGQKPNSHLV